MPKGLGLTDLLTSEIRKQKSKTKVRQRKKKRKMLRKKVNKTIPDFGIRIYVDFVKVQKDTYTFFFFLLLKPVHQHALCRVFQT